MTAKMQELLIGKETGGSIPYLWKSSLQRDRSAPIGHARNGLSVAAEEPIPHKYYI